MVLHCSPFKVEHQAWRSLASTPIRRMPTRHTPVRQLLTSRKNTTKNITSSCLVTTIAKSTPPLVHFSATCFADPDALLDDKTETLLCLRLNRPEERVKYP